MKVIIEISNCVSISSAENDDEVNIHVKVREDRTYTDSVKIEDMKLALRKLTAK
jgi:hypothetical protein